LPPDFNRDYAATPPSSPEMPSHASLLTLFDAAAEDA
jgi:hypothetical protein